MQNPVSIDHQRFTQLIHTLTDLMVFLFASALKTMPVPTDLSQMISSTRNLPDVTSAEVYQLHTILSPQSEKLLHFYDQCAMNGEFPFSEEILEYLDDL